MQFNEHIENDTNLTNQTRFFFGSAINEKHKLSENRRDSPSIGNIADCPDQKLLMTLWWNLCVAIMEYITI